MTRPEFHFTAQTGWINDPHGITYRDGGYDVFYQYVPDRTTWALNCHWGHARGADLLSLTERPPALLPGEGDDGIWTGSLVVTDEATRIFYTSVTADDITIGRVRVAHPADASWDSWSKGDVVVEAPPGLDLVGFRDPFLRKDPDTWRMFLGAGDTAGQALALSYVSPDLQSWSYEGVALERSTLNRDPAWAGAVWECPQIFELDGRFVMLSSAWDRDVLNYAAYAVGDYADGVFTAETWGQLTYGPSYYAPSLFWDAEGRPAITLWMRGIEDHVVGYAGAHSLPHRLTLDGTVLVATPHPDLHRYWTPLPEDVTRVPGRAVDIHWEGAGHLRLSSADETIATFDVHDDEVAIAAAGQEWTLPRAAPGIRIVLDGPVLEVSTDRGVLGMPVEPAGEAVQIVGDGITAYALTRHDSP